MISNRLFPRVRFSLAVCAALLYCLSPTGTAAQQATGPAILSGAILTSYTYEARTAVDADGNIYVTGGTTSLGGGSTTVAKFDPTGQTVLYAVELAQGWVSPIVIGADGNAWVGSGQKIFKLDPNGNVLLQRQVDAFVNDLALGPQGDIYVAAETPMNCQFREDPECWGTEGLVMQIDPNTGFSIRDAYISGRLNESARAIAVGPDGRVFVTGYTFSPDLPLTPNALMTTINDGSNPNAYFAAFNADLQVLYTTYLTGTNSGQGYGVAAGSDGSSYVAFEADESPVLPPGGGDVIIKFDATFNVASMRRLRGSVSDIALDAAGHLLVAGIAVGDNLASGSLPIAHTVGSPSSYSPFVAKFNADLSGFDAVFYPATDAGTMSVAVNADGDASAVGYFVMESGFTVASPVVPTNPPSWQGVSTIFVSRLDTTIAAGNTTPGANVGVAASDPATTVTFGSVTGGGTTTLEPVDPNALNLTLPGGFAISTSVIAYEIHTTATVGAPITVCLNAASLSAADRAAATILHGVGGQWTAEPTTSTASGQLCATVASLSPFAVGVRTDSSAPLISCQQADGAWHAQNVVVSCTASDPGTGLANAGDAQFTLATSVAAGTETASASTSTRQVCDRAGNCATAGPIAGHRVDMKAPSIAIASPASRAYLLNEAATVAYTCADGGSIATCTGTAANGATLNTSAAGAKTFTVTAKDAAANSATASASYSVGYAVKVLFDRFIPYKRGSVVPIVLQLTDARGTNVSAAAIALTSVTINGKAATAAQQPKFVALVRSYGVNLNTTGFAPGTYTLAFKAGSDPVVHSVPFIVK